jgi:hypothetical protein
VFGQLKSAVSRFCWGGRDTEACSVTARYARHLFLLPCHQELRKVDPDWMMNRIRRR